MKTIIFLILITLLSVSLVYSIPVTNINANYRYGQVFVTWDNVAADLFILYKSSIPILHGYNLTSAQNLGKVNVTSVWNSHQQRLLKIDSASSPLSSTKGLFVATTTANGSYYYAVTTITGNIEDTTIILGSNSLSIPVSEVVDEPRPVWQFDTLVAPKLFSAYIWFATKVTSSTFPKMTNAGTYPLNFAMVKKGTQNPHPVCFWMRGSAIKIFSSYVFGIGDPNEWIISIDDYSPNSFDYNLTWYYGYHENYDLFSNSPNSIPTTGTINNYTSAMVSHTVNWALKNLPLDSTRTYMTGWSLGGIGPIYNSLIIPSKIAAIFIYAPIFNMASIPDPDFNRLWGTAQTNLWTNEGMRRNERLNVNYLLSANKLNSMPIIYTFCGKNDIGVGWPEKIVFYDSMNVIRHGGYHFWSMGDHMGTIYSNPWQIAVLPPGISFFTRYRTNVSYPAFSNCSANNNPGNGNPTNGDSIGTINGFLDWNDNIVDSLYRWEITLKTKELITIYDTLDAPDSCTADVTLRRLQKFNPAIGNTLQWTNTKNNVVMQQGTLTFTGGLITIPNVKIYSLTNKLSLINTTIGINNNPNDIPTSYSLEQNYPNPFNSMTNVKFKMLNAGYAKLIVFDLLGKEVATLINEKLQPGTYEVKFDVRLGGSSTDLPSGVYFYILTAGEFTDTKRMILIK